MERVLALLAGFDTVGDRCGNASLAGGRSAQCAVTMPSSQTSKMASNARAVESSRLGDEDAVEAVGSSRLVMWQWCSDLTDDAVQCSGEMMPVQRWQCSAVER